MEVDRPQEAARIVKPCDACLFHGVRHQIGIESHVALEVILVVFLDVRNILQRRSVRGAVCFDMVDQRERTARRIALRHIRDIGIGGVGRRRAEEQIPLALFSVVDDFGRPGVHAHRASFGCRKIAVQKGIAYPFPVDEIVAFPTEEARIAGSPI